MAKIATRLSDSVSSVNRTDGTAPGVGFNLKELLKQAGWIHQASGTGTAGTFSTTPGNINDQITNSGTGTGGMDRASAWFVLRDPGGRREWMFQRLASSNSWRIYYSALDKFTGTGFGAISATVPPTATDQQQMVGTADAGATWMSTDNTYLHHAVAESAVEAGGNVYGWWLYTTLRGTGECSVLMCQDALKSGSYPSADTDPTVVIYTGVNGSGIDNADIYHSSTSGNFPKGYYKHDLGGEAFQTYSGCMLGHADLTNTYSAPTLTAGTDGLAQDPYDNVEVEADIVYGRSNTQFGGVNSGLKGTGARVRWCTANYRRYPSIYNRATDARVILHGGGAGRAVLTAPWPDTVEALYG